MNVKKLTGGCMGIILFVCSSLPFYAQEQPRDGVGDGIQAQKELSVLFLRLDNLLGMPVVVLTLPAEAAETRNEAEAGPVLVGELIDLIILPEGTITHALVNFTNHTEAWEWWAGNGEYLLPVATLSAGKEPRDFILDVKCPEGYKIVKVQEEQTFVQSLAAESVRARQFIDFRVVDVNNESVGVLEDLAVDVKDYKIVQLILALDESFPVKKRFFSVSFESIRYDKVKKEVQLYFSRSLFEEERGWDLDQWLKSVNTAREYKVSLE